jgi:hypothetical protein
MLKRINWDGQIGRRLRLRELHVFFTVAQHGSMSKAAVQSGDLSECKGHRLQMRRLVAHAASPCQGGAA